MNRREVLRGAGALAAVAAMGNCRRKPADLRRHLRVTLVPRFTLAPFYLADKLGYFAQRGLQIEIVPMAQSSQLLPVLAGGKVDVGFTAVTPGLANAVVRGAALKIVAARDMAVPGCTTGGTIYASANIFPGGVKDLRQLKGKRLALNNQTGVMGFFLDVILQSAGMTRKDLRIVNLRSADGVVAVLGGRVDALVAANLDKDLDLVSQKVVRAVSFADLAPNFQYTFILFGRSMLEADRKVGVDFLAAYLRGLWDFQVGKDPRVFQKLAEAGHSDLTAARNACRAGLSRDGRVEIADVKRVVDWAVAEGLCEKAPDMSQLVDNTRVEEAYRLAERGGGR